MNIYCCYQIWNYLEPSSSELSFKNDKEALDYWVDLYKDNLLVACFTIVRLVEVDGVFHEEFIAMFKQTKNGFQIFKTRAL